MRHIILQRYHDSFICRYAQSCAFDCLLNEHRDMLPMCDSSSSGDMRNPNPYLRPEETCRRHVPTLSRYVNSLKGAVTKYARTNNIDFAWQSRYHDHFIRNAKDGNNIADYILNNVARWDEDIMS